MTNVIAYPTSARERVRRQLVASKDMLDLGEALEHAGAQLSSAGRHVSLLNEPPTEHMLEQARIAGFNIIRIASALSVALAALVPAAVIPPADTE